MNITGKFNAWGEPQDCECYSIYCPFCKDLYGYEIKEFEDTDHCTCRDDPFEDLDYEQMCNFCFTHLEISQTSQDYNKMMIEKMFENVETESEGINDEHNLMIGIHHITNRDLFAFLLDGPVTPLEERFVNTSMFSQIMRIDQWPYNIDCRGFCGLRLQQVEYPYGSYMIQCVHGRSFHMHMFYYSFSKKPFGFEVAIPRSHGSQEDAVYSFFNYLAAWYIDTNHFLNLVSGLVTGIQIPVYLAMENQQKILKRLFCQHLIPRDEVSAEYSGPFYYYLWMLYVHLDARFKIYILEVTGGYLMIEGYGDIDYPVSGYIKYDKGDLSVGGRLRSCMVGSEPAKMTIIVTDQLLYQFGITFPLPWYRILANDYDDIDVLPSYPPGAMYVEDVHEPQMNENVNKKEKQIYKLFLKREDDMKFCTIDLHDSVPLKDNFTVSSYFIRKYKRLYPNHKFKTDEAIEIQITYEFVRMMLDLIQTGMGKDEDSVIQELFMFLCSHGFTKHRSKTTFIRSEFRNLMVVFLHKSAFKNKIIRNFIEVTPARMKKFDNNYKLNHVMCGKSYQECFDNFCGKDKHYFKGKIHEPQCKDNPKCNCHLGIFDRLQSFFDEKEKEATDDITIAALEKLSDKIESAKNPDSPLHESMKTLIGNVFSAVSSVSSELISEQIEEAIKVIKDSVYKFWDWISEGILGTWEKFKDMCAEMKSSFLIFMGSIFIAIEEKFKAFPSFSNILYSLTCGYLGTSPSSVGSVKGLEDFMNTWNLEDGPPVGPEEDMVVFNSYIFSYVKKNMNNRAWRSRFWNAQLNYDFSKAEYKENYRSSYESLKKHDPIFTYLIVPEEAFELMKPFKVETEYYESLQVEDIHESQTKMDNCDNVALCRFLLVIAKGISGEYDASKTIVELVGTSNAIWTVFPKIYNELMYCFTGRPEYKYGETGIQIQEFVKEVQEIWADPDRSSKCKSDLTFIDRIRKCQSLALSLTVSICANPVSTDASYQMFVQTKLVLEKIMSEMTDRKYVQARKKPLWFSLVGDSQQGKSVLTTGFARAAYDYFLHKGMTQQSGLMDNLSTFQYDGKEFWNGYHGQLICIMNECLSMKSTDEAAITALELLKIVDSAALNLNMADVSSKGAIYFVSQLLISNSNRQALAWEDCGLQSPKALINRQVHVRIEKGPREVKDFFSASPEDLAKGWNCFVAPAGTSTTTDIMYDSYVKRFGIRDCVVTDGSRNHNYRALNGYQLAQFFMHSLEKSIEGDSLEDSIRLAKQEDVHDFLGRLGFSTNIFVHGKPSKETSKVHKWYELLDAESDPAHAVMREVPAMCRHKTEHYNHYCVDGECVRSEVGIHGKYQPTVSLHDPQCWTSEIETKTGCRSHHKLIKKLFSDIPHKDRIMGVLDDPETVNVLEIVERFYNDLKELRRIDHTGKAKYDRSTQNGAFRSMVDKLTQNSKSHIRDLGSMFTTWMEEETVKNSMYYDMSYLDLLMDCNIPQCDSYGHWLKDMSVYTDNIIDKWDNMERKRTPRNCLDLILSYYYQSIYCSFAKSSGGRVCLYSRISWMGKALVVGHYVGIFVLMSTVMAAFGLAVAVTYNSLVQENSKIVELNGNFYKEQTDGSLVPVEGEPQSLQKVHNLKKNKQGKLLRANRFGNIKQKVVSKATHEPHLQMGTVNAYANIAQNMYFLTVEHRGRVRTCGILFINGGQYACVSHMFHARFDRAIITSKPMTCIPDGGHRIYSYDEFNNWECKGKFGGIEMNCDLVYGTLGNGMMPSGIHHTSIKKHLVSIKDLKEVFEVSRLTRTQGYAFQEMSASCKFTEDPQSVKWYKYDPDTGDRIDTGKIASYYPNVKIFSGAAESGDCTKPYVTYISKLNRPALVSIHISGSDTSLSSSPLCLEAYEYWVENFVNVHQAQSLQIPEETLKVLDFTKISKDLPGVDNSFGTTKFFAGTGGTNLKISPLLQNLDESDIPFEIKVAPAIREQSLNGDEVNSPWKTNDTKRCSSNTPPPPKRFFSQLKEDPGYFYKSLFRQHVAKNKRILTIEEVIFGCDYCESMATAPSSGWFGLVIKELCKRESLWNKETKWIHPKLKLAVEELRRLSELGLPMTISLQCLKDELLPIEDILKGKVRAFAVGDIVTFIACAMEFGMAAYDMKMNEEGPFVYHYNPHSHQAEKLAKSMSGKGRMTGEDASSNDCTSVDYLAFAMCYSLAVGYYGYKIDSPEYLRCINLGMTVVWFWWLRGGSLHFNYRGMASGHFLTSLFNSYCHWLMRKWAFNDLYPLEEFILMVLYKGHGDDNLSNVSKAVPDYHMAYLCDFLLKTFGFILTDPNKKKITKHYHDDVLSLDFLSRRFAHLEVGNHIYMVHKLKLDSIIGMLIYYRTGNDLPVSQAVQQNIDMACMELVYYGKGFYEEMTDKVRVLVAKSNLNIEVRPFEFFYERWKNSYFKNDSPWIGSPSMLFDESCDM